MKFSPPKTVTFWISVALAALGVLGKMGLVSAVAAYSFPLVVVAFALLAVSLMVKGL